MKTELSSLLLVLLCITFMISAEEHLPKCVNDGMTLIHNTCMCNSKANAGECTQGQVCWADAGCRAGPKTCDMFNGAQITGKCYCGENDMVCEIGQFCQENTGVCLDIHPESDHQDMCRLNSGNKEACRGIKNCYWNRDPKKGEFGVGCYKTFSGLIGKTGDNVKTAMKAMQGVNEVAIGLVDHAENIENAIERVDGDMIELQGKIGILCEDYANEWNCNHSSEDGGCAWDKIEGRCFTVNAKNEAQEFIIAKNPENAVERKLIEEKGNPVITRRRRD